MIPIIAIVGHQNVGKSTLFNNLTKTNNALISDFPGLTRDRNYGYANIKNYEFICIDTGGIVYINTDNKKDTIEHNTIKQSIIAIKDSNIIIFMVDAYVGLMPIDYLIAKYLHSYKKNILLVINKVDSIDINQVMSNFFSLGFNKIYPISALYKRGLNLLKRDILSSSFKANVLQKYRTKDTYYSQFKINKFKQKQNNSPIKLAIVGRPNVGKSTLINFLLGKERVIAYKSPGTTRDSIYISMIYDKHNYILIDTAGIRKNNCKSNAIEKSSLNKTLQAIKYANIVLLIIDSVEGILYQDLSLIKLILSSGSSLIIVFNKWDLLNDKLKKQAKYKLSYNLNFLSFSKIHFVSALHGIGIKSLFRHIQKVNYMNNRNISTSKLTRIMNMAIKNHQPPLLSHGRSIKLKYAHIGGLKPPIIVIHGNYINYLSNSYKRYLKNYFQKSLGLTETPIQIKFKEKNNLYFNFNSK